MEKQMINQILPKDYKQYQSINFCGNILVNLKYIIDDNGFIPVLIGSGEIPRVWIYAKKENNAISVVRDSIAIISIVKVNVFSQEKILTIEITLDPNNLHSKENLKILEIDFGNTMPSVNLIDLRSIGYNVYGDNKGLNIGNSKFSGNQFVNLNSLVRLENGNNR